MQTIKIGEYQQARGVLTARYGNYASVRLDCGKIVTGEVVDFIQSGYVDDQDHDMTLPGNKIYD